MTEIELATLDFKQLTQRQQQLVRNYVWRYDRFSQTLIIRKTEFSERELCEIFLLFPNHRVKQ